MNIILFDSLHSMNALSLKDERAVHILNVLHLNEGDSFKCGVFNGSKGCATISKITRAEMFFEYVPTSLQSQNAIDLTIILGAVRPICLKRIVRASGECGVKRVILTGTELGEKSYLNSGFITNGEADKTIKDAAMQSGETNLLSLEVVANVKDAIALIGKSAIDNCGNQASDCSLFILDNKTEFYKTGVPFLQDTPIITEHNVIAIGSERGWTDRERAEFIKSGFLPRKLSSRILRTETAVAVALFPFLN